MSNTKNMKSTMMSPDCENTAKYYNNYQTQTPAYYSHSELSVANIKQLHALSKSLCCDSDNEINSKRLRARGMQILADLNEIVIEK